MDASVNSADDFPFKKSLEAHAKSLGMPLPSHLVSGPEAQGNSAVETLLMNILSLLKVAIENARLMEEQAKHEKSKGYKMIGMKIFLQLKDPFTDRDKLVRKNIVRKTPQSTNNILFDAFPN
jgi:hypothetical protein